MQVKKSLMVLLALVLLLTGLFFWKGGHHAIAVSQILEQWLDADAADQTLILQVMEGGFSVDPATGRIEPQVEQMTLTANTFWMEYADEEVFGLTTGGATAYLRRDILYMDTGRAYSLSGLSDLRAQMRNLAAGLLLYGRITKHADTYNLTMDTQELSLSVSITADKALQSVTLSAVLSDDTAVSATLTPRATRSHPIPQAVTDAMVLAQMERPMDLSGPLEVLLPALQDLMPLTGKLKLGISSGILSLSEEVDLTISGGRVSLARGGIAVDVSLPDSIPALSPVTAAILALRSGNFTREAEVTTVTISIPGDATADLTESLIPQAAGLGIDFEESTLVLTITSGKLTAADISAGGSVPFLFTTIPVSFTANLSVT